MTLEREFNARRLDVSIYDPDVFIKYKSKSQRIRVLTEHWFIAQMYCPNCLSMPLQDQKNNTKVVDFSCSRCDHEFQLKSQGKGIHSKVVDGAYVPMMERIEKNQAPDFFFMEYVPEEWVVRNLFLIPRFFMNSSIIEKRTPLSRSARRAGWTGCNILFSRLPEDARIAIITDEKGIDPTEVRKKYRALDFLDSRNHLQRGWISDILYFVRRIGKPTFDLAEVYHFEDELKGLHPGNTHIRDKIRQQLQFLRDKGILSFEGKGKYTLLR